MAQRSVNLNSIMPGTSFMIRGKLSFSRVTSLIEGEELTRRVESARKNGSIPVETPHTTASISEAQFVKPDDPNTIDPNQLKLIETYVNESLYQSKQHPERGWCYTGYNKGNRLPSIGVLNPANKTVQQVTPEGELANGLDVTLVMTVYKPKRQINNGLSMESIIVNEPIRYYDGSANGVGQALAGYGLTFVPDAAAANAQRSVHGGTPAGMEPVDENPFAANAPAPVQPPSGNPYSTAPQQASPYANYNYQQQPAAQAAAPAPAPAQNPYAGQPQGQPQPQYEAFEPNVQVAAPAPAPAPTQGALKYDGSDKQY